MVATDASEFFKVLCHPSAPAYELRPLPSRHRSWHDPADIDGMIQACDRAARRGDNCYLGILPRRGKGESGNAGVAFARCVFADFDGRHLKSNTAAEQVAEVRRRIADACLPDGTMIVFSGHGVHVYWIFSTLVNDLVWWDVLMDALITALGSDPGAKGADRVMRIPGYLNLKEPVAMCELIECVPDRLYEPEDVACAVFHANLPAPAEIKSVEKAIAAKAVRGTVGDRASVINAFNAAVPVAEVLKAAGYDVVGHHFRRPGKSDRGFSGVLRPNKAGLLVSAHWSSADPVNDRRFGGGTCGIHDAFDLFTLIDHGGDVSAAVKSAAAMLGIALPKQKADRVILEEITTGADGDAFAELVFADPQTAEHRVGMRRIIARHTSNPKQSERLMAELAQAGSAVPA